MHTQSYLRQFARFAIMCGAIATMSALPRPAAAQPSTVYMLSTNWVNTFDTDTGALRLIPTGNTPLDMAISPDGTKAWIANFNSWTITVADLVNGTVLNTIPVLQNPMYVAITPDSKKLFVLQGNGGEMQVINTDTNTIIKDFYINLNDGAMAIYGNKLFVGVSSSVWVINTNTYEILAKIPVGTYATSIAFNADGSLALVVNNHDFTVTEINTNTYTAVATTPVGQNPGTVTYSPDFTKAYMLAFYPSLIDIINPSNLTVTSSFPVISNPSDLAVSPDGATLFVASPYYGPNNVGQLVSYSTSTQKQISTISATKPIKLKVASTGFGLVRYRNTINGDHYYATSTSLLGGVPNNYVFDGVAGRLRSNRDTSAGWVPYYRFVKSGTYWYQCTTDYNSLASISGEVNQGIVGYVYPGNLPSHPLGTVPMYGYGNSITKDHYYTTDYSQLGAGGANGWVSEGISAYVMSTVSISGVSISPATVTPGQSATGTVTLSGPEQTAITIPLSCDNAAVTVPNSVTIPAGATSASFNVTAAQLLSTPRTANITAAYNGTVTTPFAVSFTSVLTNISVAPATPSVTVNASQLFTATSTNQYGAPMVPTPVLKWTSSGGGIITAGGLYTAGSIAGGPFTVSATAADVSGYASVTVVRPPNAPTGLAATPGNAQAVLSWTGSSGAASYNVLRSTVSGSGYTPAATGLTTTKYTDTGLTLGPTYYYVVQAVNAGLASANSNQASALPYLKINAGGPAVPPFMADTYSSGPLTNIVSNTINTTGVTNPAPMAVYQTQSYGEMIYSLPGLTPGRSFKVRLHFSENVGTAAGQRKFNVAINGAPVLTNFDVFAKTGAQFKACCQDFTATADPSGQIVVYFSNGAADLAIVNGLEVLP